MSQAERLSFKASTVVAIVTLSGSLLAAAVAGAWKAAIAFSEINQKLDAVSDINLRTRFYLRSEAAKHHRDLEKALSNAGLKLHFPPPVDPGDYVP